MPGSEANYPDDPRIEIGLHQALYRFDCPPPQALGDYHLQLLPADESVGVAQHVVTCDECQTELDLLRAYLRQQISAPESALARARRLVARLLPPAHGLAYGGLRGSAAPAVRVYEVDDVTITIGPGQTAQEVIGLVMVTSRPPEELVGCAVRLIGGKGPAGVAALDDIGNFELPAVRSGTYELEIELPDAVVAIETLQVG